MDLCKVELWSLVLLALAICHRIERSGGDWVILVAEENVGRASRELAAFERENLHWPPSEVEPPVLSAEAGRLPLVVVVFLTLFYNVVGAWGDGNLWFRQGMVDGQAILHGGQWWRVVTGLTLHADINHLLGNISLGGLVLYYLGLETGGGVACFLALLTGAAGNLLNTFFHGSGYQSVGFSTAVFGMIGVLSGLRVMDRGYGLKGVLGPLGAGAGLLAMLGTGGERTDLGAHLWGIVVGLLSGMILYQLQKVRILFLGKWLQGAWAILTILIVCGAWCLARCNY